MTKNSTKKNNGKAQDTYGNVEEQTVLDSLKDQNKKLTDLNSKIESLLSETQSVATSRGGRQVDTRTQELSIAIKQAENKKFIEDLNVEFDKKLIDIFADVADIDQHDL